MPTPTEFQEQEIWNRVFNGTSAVRTGGVSTTSPSPFLRPTQEILNLSLLVTTGLPDRLNLNG